MTDDYLTTGGIINPTRGGTRVILGNDKPELLIPSTVPPIMKMNFSWIAEISPASLGYWVYLRRNGFNPGGAASFRLTLRGARRTASRMKARRDRADARIARKQLRIDND